MNLKKSTMNLFENKNFHFSVAISALAILTLWIINALNISYPISVTTKQASGELAVVGEGKVDAIPDTASVDLGIIVNNKRTVQETQNEINRINNQIVEAMKKLEINEKDIKTSNYSIYPNYNYEISSSGEIVGYNGNVTISIKVKSIETLPQILVDGTNAGANQILGTNYNIDSPEKYREQARNEAIENARAQAKELANRLGIKLGKITNIVESNNNPPVFYDRTFAMEGMGGSGTPSLQPGSQTITSTVTLYFEKR